MTAKWMAALLMAAMGAPGWAQSQPAAHFPVTADQIARTLSDRGMQITDDRISMLANVVATEPHPMLDIVSVEPLGVRRSEEHAGTHSLIKLACHTAGACLPFFVVVNTEATTAANTATGTAASTTAASTTAAPSTPPMRLIAQPKANAPITMRVGTHATLVMEDNRAHIQVAVISLENGHTGDKIHVASPDRKQVYVAEVVGPNLLKGSF
jgi:hypothetical protein